MPVHQEREGGGAYWPLAIGPLAIVRRVFGAMFSELSVALELEMQALGASIESAFFLHAASRAELSDVP